jgi:hypothetical protein
MLADVFRAVQRDFRESGCPARVLFGELHKAVNAEPNRVVFIPRKDPPYGNVVATVTGGSATGANPRAYMSRHAGCDIWIWGASGRNDLGEDQLAADYDVLNALINQTALSLYRTMGLGHVLDITGGGHDVNALIVNRGLAYKMGIRVEIPIVDIDFPCGGAINECSKTWTLQSDVTALVTLNAIAPGVPTGTVMSYENFLVNKDTGNGSS